MCFCSLYGGIKVQNTFTRKQMAALVTLGGIAYFLISVSLAMIVPVLATLIFAAVVTILTYPATKWVSAGLSYIPVRAVGVDGKNIGNAFWKSGWTRNRPFENSWVTAIVTWLLMMIFIIVPSYIGVSIMIERAISLAQYAVENQDTLRESLSVLMNDKLSLLPEVVRENVTGRLDALLGAGVLAGSRASSFVLQMVAGATFGLLDWVTTTAVFLISLLLMYEGGARALLWIQNQVPLAKEYGDKFFEQFAGLVKAIFMGTFLVNLAQVSVYGLVMWIMDAPGWNIWVIVMLAMSAFPSTPGLLMFGAIAGAFLSDNYAAAGVMLVTTLIAGNLDNVARGYIVSKYAEVHPTIVIGSTFLGMIKFGAAGIIIGPAVMALTILAVKLLRIELEVFFEQDGSSKENTAQTSVTKR